MKKVLFLILICISLQSQWLNSTGKAHGAIGLNGLGSVGLYNASAVVAPDAPLTLTANADTVLIGGYFAPNTANTNFGLAVGNDFEFLNYGEQYRIRQNGLITMIDLCVNDTTNVTGLYLKIWSMSSGIGTIVSKSENFLSQITALGQIVRVRFATPIQAYEGNYYSIYSQNSNTEEFKVIADNSSGLRYIGYPGGGEAGTGENWATRSPLNFGYRINMYMTPAPIMVFLGNSLTWGIDHSYVTEGTPSPDITGANVHYKVADSLNYTVQNMGRGGWTATNGLSVFGTDVVNLKPKIAVIEFLLNDIYGGASIATIVSAYTSMLDSCVLHGIYPILWLPTSWTNGTNAQMLKLDSAVTQIKALALTYDAGVADDGLLLGVERDTGTPAPTAGNHWNLNGSYTSDGTHRNATGNALTAGLIDSIILNDYYNYTPKATVPRRLIPVLTSDSSASPVRVYCSNQITPTFEIWRAFDADKTDPTDVWSTNSIDTGWAIVDFGHDTTVVSYDITARAFASFDWRSWVFYGSADSLSWTAIDTQTGVAVWSELETRRYTFSPATFRYFKWNVTENQGGAYLQAVQLQLYGY